MEAHGVDTSFFGGTSELTSSEQSGALCDKQNRCIWLYSWCT